MNVGINILNRSHEATEEFIIFQTNNDPRDLPDRIAELMTVEQWNEVEAGDWVMVIDGEVEVTGSVHPFLIIATDDDDGEDDDVDVARGAYDLMERSELYSLAAEHDIEGRSSMSRQGLIEALRESGDS